MSPAVRRVVFLIAAVGLAFGLVKAMVRTPAFGDYRGPYGLILNQVAVPQRHVTDIVAAVNFDYRGVDTIGEEYILFVAVTSVLMLLRTERDESEADEPPAFTADQSALTSDAISFTCRALVGPTVVLGLYIIAHGHLTPGGGFQGGGVLANACLLLFLGGEFGTFRTLSPSGLIAAADALGAGGYVAIGCIGLLAGAAFLQNVLPLGPVGLLYSSGMIPLINLSVGLEVGAGFVVILVEFVRQTLQVRAERQSGREREQEGSRA